MFEHDIENFENCDIVKSLTAKWARPTKCISFDKSFLTNRFALQTHYLSLSGNFKRFFIPTTFIRFVVDLRNIDLVIGCLSKN